jgi:integrase
VETRKPNESPRSSAINATILARAPTQRLGGGRTRARTWDPMIKRHLDEQRFQRSFRFVLYLGFTEIIDQFLFVGMNRSRYICGGARTDPIGGPSTSAKLRAAHTLNAGEEIRFVVNRTHDGAQPVGKIRSTWDGIVEDAGFGEDVVRHSLRHTAATWLMQRGTNPWVGLQMTRLPKVALG